MKTKRFFTTFLVSSSTKTTFNLYKSPPNKKDSNYECADYFNMRETLIEHVKKGEM